MAAAVVHKQPSAPALPADALAAKARDILQATGETEGYALVLGLDSGQLVEELARRSDLHVIDKQAQALLGAQRWRWLLRQVNL